MIVEEKVITEERILAAAEVIFLRDGYSGSRMQDIADEANINKAMLHYYFRSKDRLFEHIFEKKVALMFPQMEELFSQDLPFVDLICRYVENYMALFMANPFLPLFVITSINKADRQDFMEKMPVALNRKLIEACIKDRLAGKIKPIDAFQFMISVFSMCAFPFMAKPMLLRFTSGNDEQFKVLMQNRTSEIQRYIKFILTP